MGRSRKRKRFERRRRACIDATVAALRHFRGACRIHGKRMSILRTFVDIRFDEISMGVYYFMRAQSKQTRRDWPSSSPCFVCGEPTTIVHHVIQLQHGGADIDANKVPLCDTHHADLHPWLPTDETPVDNLWS